MIISRTPFRISFFGGGTDYPDWYLKNSGSVLATTIDKYCYISCRYLPSFFDHKYRIVYSRIENVRDLNDIEHPSVKGVLKFMEESKGLEIHHDGDLPARAGLGSSSSFTVGLINALMAKRGLHISKEDLASRAIHVEQNLIGESVGSQDQISASFGGFNQIDFQIDGSFKVNPVILTEDRKSELQSHLMLFFTGVSRIASDIAKSKISNFEKRENELKQIGKMVTKAVRVLQSDTPIAEFGNLLHDTWTYKKSLSQKVTTEFVDQTYEAARRAGAIGGKLLGAGGGGFMLLFAPPNRHQIVKKTLSKLVHVPFSFENTGSRIALYQPEGL
tara:strand:- start:302 stop:1294 length:993 start_codon:yes stop_codon:yes gene_type:complete